MREKIKSYLIELTIVTLGVLIALFLSNVKENNQERTYHTATIETIYLEIQDNYSSLKGIVEAQINLLDTLKKFAPTQDSILNIFQKTDGLQIATISNVGLDFYTKDQISSIDFEMMSKLIRMKSSSDLLISKADKLVDFTYANILDNSIESKTVVILHLQNVLNSEKKLLELYENFIDEYIQTENK